MARIYLTAEAVPVWRASHPSAKAVQVDDDLFRVGATAHEWLSLKDEIFPGETASETVLRLAKENT